MISYEYKVVSQRFGDELEPFLNANGHGGWSLVSYMPQSVLPTVIRQMPGGGYHAEAVPPDAVIAVAIFVRKHEAA